MKKRPVSMTDASASGGTWRAPRGQPFLVLSLLLHAGLLLALFIWGHKPVKPMPPEQRQARMTVALEQARRTQMQRQVRSLQEMQQALLAKAGEAGERANEGESTSEPMASLPTDPQALLQRAQALADRIKQTEQKTRAAELARLLKIQPEAALAQIKAEEKKQAAANPAPAPKTPAAAIAQLEQQARSALERQQQREKQRDQQREQGTLLMADNKATNRATNQAQNNPADPAQGAPAGGGGFSDPRVYGAMLKSADINGQTLRVGAGRVLGPGGPAATRVYLNSWYILGPFEGLSSDSLKEIYPPEVGGGAGVDLDAAFEGLRGRVLQWQYQSSAAYPFVPQPRAENAVYFAYTEIMVDEAREVWLDIGADDDSKLWLNDALVWTSGNSNKPWYRQPFYQLKDDIGKLNLVEGSQRVKLRAGRNTLLLKLYNGIDLMFFSVVLSPVNPNP
jgi:hypothetical protein